MGGNEKKRYNEDEIKKMKEYVKMKCEEEKL